MATPIILCGVFEEFGALFQAQIMPDFEVTHFVASPEDGLVDIPLLLKGEKPTSGPRIGTGDYSKPAQAIVVGAKYDDAWVQQLRARCKEVGGVKFVPLFKPDLRGVTAMPSIETAKAGAERALKLMTQMRNEGRLDGSEKGIFLF